MSNYCQLAVFLVLFAAFAGSPLMAAEAKPQDLAARPFITFFASSISNLLNVCDLIFDTVERPDLADSLDARLKRYNGFAGIDRNEPLGMMFTWNVDAISHVVFLPIEEMSDLLTTSTFNVVGFHKVSDQQYEIERPYAPYHVLVRDNYAYMADSLSTIHAMRATPNQLTRRLRDQYDVVVSFDLQQIPKQTKSNFVNQIRRSIEPMLQRHDDEASESARLRRTLGEMALNLMDRAVLDTSQLTIGIRLDPQTRHLRFEIAVNASPKSRMAIALNKIQWQQSKLAPLMQSDATAGLVLNMTTSTMIQEILGTSDEPLVKGRRLEAGFKLIGQGFGDLSMIVALNGPDVRALNRVLPDLLIKLEDSGQFQQIDPNFDEFLGVVLHSLTPRRLPKAITDWIGLNGELIVGQGKETIWIGIGPQEKVQDRLEEAIRLLEEQSPSRSATPVVQGSLQARKLPELVASDVLLPNLDSSAIREVLSEGEDRFHLKIEPIQDGFKILIECEQGFTRLIGRDWIRQIESTSRE